MLEAFRRDPQVMLVDTARRLSAQPTRIDPKAQRWLQEGIFELEQKRARRALALLVRAQRELRRDLSRAPKRALADVELHLAAAQWMLRRRRPAERTLVELMTWRGARKLALRSTPPRGWKKALRQARAVMERRGSGALRITSVPARAETYVDGRRTGPTPALISNLLIGTHYVTVRLPGYKKVVVAATVRSSEQTIAVTLRQEEAAHEMLSMLRDMRQEMGRKSVLFPDTLRTQLGLGRAFVVVVSRRGSKLELAAYVYDMKKGQLRSQAKSTATAPPRPGELDALAVWRVTKAPKLPPKRVASGPPFYKRWWFWAIVGAVGTAGVVIPLAATAGTDPGRSERFRVTW